LVAGIPKDGPDVLFPPCIRGQVAETARQVVNQRRQRYQDSGKSEDHVQRCHGRNVRSAKDVGKRSTQCQGDEKSGENG